MDVSDEEQDLSDASFEEVVSDEEMTTKRKKHIANATPLKKIKYENITSKTKKPKNELYKPPTVEELNELKETQNLYNNNLFRLQIEELIKEVKIKNKHRKTLTAWLEQFQIFLNELPQHEILLSKIKTSSKKKFNSAIANNSIKCDQDLTVKFMKPESSEIFGLDTLNALPGPKLITNINLKMPKSCFNVKDYVNNRYFVKRYFYLAYILYYLKDKGMGEVTWTWYNNDTLLPILQVKLNEKNIVKIFATPTENYFKPSRCSADRNNVKVNVFTDGGITEAPTLFYNASLAHDITLTVNQTFIKETLSILPNVQEAIKLIHVWLNQRELQVFTDDLIVYFITYLIIKKRINRHMSSYQIIRNLWNFIKETDLTEGTIGLSEDSKTEVLNTFRANYDVVFLDKTGYYNVASFLNSDLYKKIKTESALAFKLLDDGGINCFHSLFITKLPTELQYDLILTLHDKSKLKKILQKMDDQSRTKFLGHPQLFLNQYIRDILHRGLNKRASLITPLTLNDDKITFGINLDPEHAFSILELGPALNDPKEAEFREFWEELSTDRRFKDGSVCVAVYFPTETIKQRRDIIKTILDWIVKKLNLDYTLHYNDFEDLLINKKVTAAYPLGTNEEGCLKAIAASDELAKKLRGLEMPLAITGVQGISDTFSMTEVFPSISTTYRCGGVVTKTLENNIIINEKRVGVVPRFVKPIECVLQLEHSSKWPKDLPTLQKMKTAFYLEISKSLAKKHKIVSSVRRDDFDVLYEGYVFRYRLYLPREVGLMKKETTSNGLTVYRDTPQSRDVELQLNIKPKIVGALKGLQSQYSSFGPATALIKRWLRSQLLDHYHMSDDVINLLNASLFLNQSAFSGPASPQIAFLRFLKFFSEFQWQIQVVVVNFNDEIAKETVTEIESKLLQNRDSYPNLFIAMPYDGCESLFTKSAPSKEVLFRVKQLSQETLVHFSKMIKGESLIKAKNLFIPNLDGYDLVIELRPLLNPVRHEQVIADDLEGQVVLKAFDAKESIKIPVTGFNPIQCYLKELRDNYGEFANFFHDTYGGNVIGVLWIPKAVEVRDFKVAQVNGRKLRDGKLILNKEALIEDFYILGKGLVKSINQQT